MAFRASPVSTPSLSYRSLSLASWASSSDNVRSTPLSIHLSFFATPPDSRNLRHSPCFSLFPFASYQILLPNIPFSRSNIKFAIRRVVAEERLGSSSGTICWARFIACETIVLGDVPKQLEPVMSVNWLAAGVPGGHRIFPSSSIITPKRAAALPIRLPPGILFFKLLPRLFS